VVSVATSCCTPEGMKVGDGGKMLPRNSNNWYYRHKCQLDIITFSQTNLPLHFFSACAAALFSAIIFL
jgi:hypothetical protein